MNKLLAALIVFALPLSSLAAATNAGAGLKSLNGHLAAGSDQAATLDQFFDQANARAGTLPSGNPETKKQIKQQMLQELDVIQSVFAAQYGPGLWKVGHNGWDLNKQIAAAKAKVEATPNISMEQYHDVLRDFFNSTKDYHVSVSFNATAASSLPFGVIGSNGRYFIAWIDRTKLTEQAFPFKVGDEVVSFGGRKTADVVKDIQKRLGSNTALTDRALASMILTSRKAASSGNVQSGAVTVGVIPQGQKTAQTRQLTWDTTPESIRQDGIKFNALDFAAKNKPLLPQMGDMTSPVGEQVGVNDRLANPFSLGGKVSWVPELGEKTWQSEDDATFNAYIYKNKAGKSIGVIRIPSYEVDDAKGAVAEFAAVIKDFQSKTDALVIDQVNNPGGAVLYLYALASLLSDRPLNTPPHHVAITREDVGQAQELLKVAPLVTNDAMAKRLLGPEAQGYPVDYGFFKRMVDYSNFIVDQFNNKGKTLTDPVHIEGVDAINPSAVAQYTKPILLLINELDFSGGDFFPAIMQDNRRATLFGTRTAGAGGFIREVKIPNQVGVDHFVVTGSIAVRSSNQPIENLGVTADVQYAPTPADLQDGFKGYAAAVNAAVAKLIGGSAAVGK